MLAEVGGWTRYIPGLRHQVPRLDVPLDDDAVYGGIEGGIELAQDLLLLAVPVLLRPQALVVVVEEWCGAGDVLVALLDELGDGDGVVQAVGGDDLHGLGIRIHVSGSCARRGRWRRIRYAGAFEVVGAVELGPSRSSGRVASAPASSEARQ